MNNYKKVNEILNNSNNIIAVTGAGISTDSGIPDFRSSKGIYNNYAGINPEEILSLDYFKQYPKEFYEYYYEHFNLENYNPNEGHKFLQELEEQGNLNAVVTQNVDLLQEKSGSNNVLHIHGKYNKGHCTCCNKEYSLDEMVKLGTPPICPNCNNIIKVDVTLYNGDPLPIDFYKAENLILHDCDTLLIIGTSLSTMDTLYLVNNCTRLVNNIIIINNQLPKYLYKRPNTNYYYLEGNINEVINELKELNKEEPKQYKKGIKYE